MTALATIISERKEDIVLVPSLAIDDIDWVKYVQVVNENDEIEFVEVEVWLTDNFNTEIVRWVSEWTEIIESVLTQEDFEKMWITPEWDSIFGGE